MRKLFQCFSVFADRQNVYLVLEWCNMGTLKSYVDNKKRLGEKEGKLHQHLTNRLIGIAFCTQLLTIYNSCWL